MSLVMNDDFGHIIGVAKIKLIFVNTVLNKPLQEKDPSVFRQYWLSLHGAGSLVHSSMSVMEKHRTNTGKDKCMGVRNTYQNKQKCIHLVS